MSDPKIAELIAMGEKARAELETGNYIRGVQSENVQCSICLAPPPYGSCAGDEACAYTMLLQRRIELLLTEIKGHMRVVDELKAAVASLERKLDDIVNTMKHAGMKVPGWIEHTDQDGKLRRDNLTIAATLMFELEAWRARIAELEKAVSEFVVRHDAIEPALHGVFTFYSVHGMVWPADKNWKRELDALRAALKSRA